MRRNVSGVRASVLGADGRRGAAGRVAATKLAAAPRESSLGRLRTPVGEGAGAAGARPAQDQCGRAGGSRGGGRRRRRHGQRGQGRLGRGRTVAPAGAPGRRGAGRSAAFNKHTMSPRGAAARARCSCMPACQHPPDSSRAPLLRRRLVRWRERDALGTRAISRLAPPRARRARLPRGRGRGRLRVAERQPRARALAAALHRRRRARPPVAEDCEPRRVGQRVRARVGARCAAVVEEPSAARGGPRGAPARRRRARRAVAEVVARPRVAARLQRERRSGG